MRDILAALTSSLNFRTFVNVLVAADLIEDLRGCGPLLVRAPTDEAFERASPSQLRALFDERNVEALVDFAERCVSYDRAPRMGREHDDARGAAIIRCRNGRILVADEVSLPPLLRLAARGTLPVAKANGHRPSVGPG